MFRGVKLLRACAFGGLLLTAFFVTSNAGASTVIVGTCKSGLPQYDTIQEAVNAAPSGSVIEICPGTYPEQVTVNSKKLTLTGTEAGTSDAAVVVVPSGGMVQNASDINGNPVAAQIFVENATGVTISSLTVDGSGNGLSGCSPNFEGIYYQNSSGTITDDAVRNQIIPSEEGCQTGLAINVESSSGTPGITISNNSVRNYQKNGITAAGLGTGAPGPKVSVTGNTVIGIGATPAIAQNGIQISYGATGSVTSNDVADDIYSGATYGAAGILIYASTGITVSNNTIESTQLAIATAADPTYGLANDATVSSNHIGGTQTFDAIDLCSNDNVAESNIIYGSAHSGIHSDDECPGPSSAPSGNNNTIERNTINEACAAILEGSGTGNTFSSNTIFNVTYTTLAGDSCPAAAAEVKAAGSSENHRSLRTSPFKT
jgi:hypothetical protein